MRLWDFVFVLSLWSTWWILHQSATKCRLQTAADHCLHHSNENVTTIIPLFCNTENNGLQSVCSQSAVCILYCPNTENSENKPRGLYFSKALFEGLIFGGACIRLGQPYSWKEIYRFSLRYFVFEGDFQVKALWGAYIWRGDLTKGFLSWECGRVYIWRGLYMEGLFFRILRY